MPSTAEQREAWRADYNRRRESILEKKREKSKDPKQQEKRRAYLSRPEVRARRRKRQRDRYRSDPYYRSKRLEAAKAYRNTPEGRAKNLANSKLWREKNPVRFRKLIAKWQEDNADYVRAYWRRYKKKRFAEDPSFKVKEYMRRRVRLALENVGAVKDATTMGMVGCDAATLVIHLESQFKEGMSWDNYGEWHVDHIRELCDFDLTNPKEQAAAFHYSNLRPLWAVENMGRPNRSKNL